MRVHIRSTSSKKHEGKLPFASPWSLVTHQWEVYQALHDPDVDVVFDNAMTGDGKTLAAFLPLLRPSARPLGNGLYAYPTNELIRDQERQIRGYQETFSTQLRVQTLDGPTLSSYAEQKETSSRYAAILDLISRRNVLLTNPDMFSLIEGFEYVNPLQNPATLAQQLANRFRYMVFDEFHIFGAPQVATVMDAMLFMRANQSDAYPMKYLFLSATPHSILEEMLERANFRVKCIQGQYQHGPVIDKTYRRILQDATLEVISSSPGAGGGVLSWCQENIDSLRAFFSEHPQSKGAIICNSVFAAKQLYSMLKDELEPGISVGENTGLTGRDARKRSFEADLMVATATVDVGVDFRINLLIFESRDAGTFIQRLGRLGRHEGFGTYRAVALLPKFIAERFTDAYEDGQEVDRMDLYQNVRENFFPEHRRFEEYITRWGGVKATQRLSLLCKPQVKTTYEELTTQYEPPAVRTFRINRATFARTRQASPAVCHELRAFRGAGLLDVWAYDTESEAVTTVSILRLISGTEFELISKQEAEKIASRLNQPFYPPVLKLYASIVGYQEEYLRYQLCCYEPLVDNLTPLYNAVERTHFYIEALHSQIGTINRNLERLPLCTCAGSPEEDVPTLRRRYALPPMFELYPVTDSTGRIYPVAFGQDALLLDSILHWRKTTETYIV